MKAKDLWLEFNVEVTRPDGLKIIICGLCANSGIVDTTFTAKIYDKQVGIESYCICPNGRAMKNHK